MKATPPGSFVGRVLVHRVLTVLLAVAGLLLAGPAVAGATQGDSYLRLAHLSPDTPNVDVYVASVSDPARSFVVPGVGYGAVSPYQPLPSGSYVISMRGAGAAPDSPAGRRWFCLFPGGGGRAPPPDSPAVISTSVDARPGGAYTVAGVGMSAELGLAVLSDKLETPAAGKASVRVINGAASAPAVDVGPANGPTWAGPVKFGTDTPYVDVPLGTWNLKVTSPDGGPELTTPCQLDANSTYTVLLVDRGGALKAELLTDSAGSAVVPSGGVNAGYGGMADRVGVDPAALAGVLIMVVAAGLVLAVWQRRARNSARGR
jgi:hypothetical protein